MSPHERRKYEKKRGLQLNFSEARVLPDNEQTESRGLSNHDNLYESCDFRGQLLNTVESGGQVKQMNGNMKGSLVSSEFEANAEEGCWGNGKVVNLGTGSLLARKDAPLCSELHGSSKHDVTTAVEPCHKSDQAASTSLNSKVSLLGHGPHGKKVVDYLLKEYGEEGVFQFCQRWRQVFVDAVQPQYLPAGWDVMHSGRRDFGEFSVYKPAKKPAAACPNESNFIEGSALHDS